VMGEIEGSYRPLQTPGTRLGVSTNVAVRTLEPGQSLSTALANSARNPSSGNGLQIRVEALDETQEVYEMESKSYGQELMTKVFQRFNLIENDYFGLEFQNMQMHWMKRDLLEGKLTCSENTAALLASHLLQSEIGDFDEAADREHLKRNKLLPNQERLQEKIMEFHQRHLGQTPAESDFQVLEISRKLEMYGIRFHSAADREGTKINLAVSHMGLQVFQGPHQDTLEFLMASRDQCKVFWKNCVEYHTFFRLLDQPEPKSKPILFSRGSSFRYRRHSRARISTRTLGADLPKQSLSYNEGLKVPGSPSSATISFHSLHASSMPPCPEPEPAQPPTPLQEDPGKGTPKPLHSFQGISMDNPQLSPFAVKSHLTLSPSFQMSTLSLPGQAPSPLQSPILSEVGTARLDEEEEGRKKRYPADKAYFIAKEILTTERTYLKDLEVITVWFRSAVIKENAMPEGLMTLLFSNIDPIYEFHRGFLKEIDQRLALWEGRSNAHVKGDYQRIGDVMLRNMCSLKEFTSYLQKHDEVLTELEKATKRLKKLETVYKEFELQKVCYLPLNTFLLKPIQRLMHYKLILERLCKHYTPDHQDYSDCKDALKEVAEMAAQLQSSLIRLENFQKLTELQRDLIGIESLTASGRIEENENELSVPHCFTIYSAQRTIVVAASSKVEMGKWIEDLNVAIEMAKMSQEKSDLFLDTSRCDRSNRSSDEVSLEQESEDDTYSSHSSLDKQTHHRANTTMHVCWHRNTSVSMSDHSLAVENQLSGYLLRKFKNSNGWQKLWVVFTNFCLFFYKTHQDDFPLASLPLLGYTVSTPAEADSIHKEYVFKLQFKSHVYYFRAESEYTFERYTTLSLIFLL
ncbi:UNVERIFIED_CONTAM: hypothetical protein FKN15_053533, partial [Acipenser sinensis]